MSHVLNGLTINGVEVDWCGTHSRIMFRSIPQMGSYSSRVKMAKQVGSVKSGGHEKKRCHSNFRCDGKRVMSLEKRTCEERGILGTGRSSLGLGKLLAQFILKKGC